MKRVLQSADHQYFLSPVVDLFEASLLIHPESIVGFLDWSTVNIP